MTRPPAPHAGEQFRRRSRETTLLGRRSDGVRTRQRGRTPEPAGLRLVVVAESPEPAGLSTRLRSAYSPEQATVIAEAAVTDTLRAVGATPTTHRPSGWATTATRLEQALADAGRGNGPSLLIASEIPQLNPELLADAAALLHTFDAVLGPTSGSGWWAFGVRDPAHSAALAAMPSALRSTGALTLAALRLGLRVAMLPTLQEVTTGADVHAVARLCPPGSRFAETVARLEPAGR